MAAGRNGLDLRTLTARDWALGILCALFSAAVFGALMPLVGLSLPEWAVGMLAGGAGVLVWFAILKRIKG